MGKDKPSKTPAVAYDIEEWMSGLKGASDGEPKQKKKQKQNGDTDCRAITEHSLTAEEPRSKEA